MTQNNWVTIMRNYLDQIQDLYRTAIISGEATPELSYRPALDSFFREIVIFLDMPEVKIIHEPKKQDKAGRPDWRFHHETSLGVFGYIEGKGISTSSKIDWSGYEHQIEKYLELGHNLILTDGIEFVFFFNGEETPTTYYLIDKPFSDQADWKSLQTNPGLDVLFSRFLDKPSPRPISDENLIFDLALRAKILSEDIEEMISLNPGEGIDSQENKTIIALRELKTMLKTEHDPELETINRFSKAVAQVLVFGLFYAHRHTSNTEEPGEKKNKMEKFWINPIRQDNSNRLRPFRALARILSESGSALSLVNLWYSDCLLYLSYIKLTEDQRANPDYHYLYEQFLTRFDRADKVDFGAYSSPHYLADLMIHFSSRLAENEFESPLFCSNNKIIDPCCGTGTFLESIIRFAHAEGINTDEMPVIAGFEILPAPYALAQYRLIQLNIQEFTLAEDVTISLCNTLSNYLTINDLEPLDEHGTAAEVLLRAERHEAAEYAQPPITLIIGNPPSSDAGLHTDFDNCSKIIGLLDDFRPPSDQRCGRSNIQKQINNDFVKFLRWACLKLGPDENGIISFIIPSSFLQHNSYKYARKWLLENFSKIWTIEFDEDGRSGIRTNNVFPTLQGRCIVFCLNKRENESPVSLKYVSFLSLNCEDKKRKFKDLNKMLESGFQNIEEEFSLLTPSEGNFYSFKPQRSYDHDTYDNFWKLAANRGQNTDQNDHVFIRHCSGLKLGITAALVHPDHSLLNRRTRDMGSSMQYEELKNRWFEGQRKPPRQEKLTPRIREKIKTLIENNDNVPPNIEKYSFRPFLNLYAFLPESVLSELASIGGGGTRYRPEVLSAYSRSNNFGISVAPAPADIGKNIQRFATFAWHIPDNDLCARGNAHIFCPFFPEYKTKQSDWNSKAICNINNHLIARLTNIDVDTGSIEEKISFYTYAILTSNAYLDKFEGVLYRTAGDWPRIPFPNNAKVFERLADLGKRLANLEKMPPKFQEPPETSSFRIFLQKEIDLSKFKIDEEKSNIKITDENGNCYLITDIDREVLTYQVSGYGVIAEWLKRFSKPYLRRKVNYNDFKALYVLSDMIKIQFEIIAEVDQELLAMFESGTESLLSP